MNLALDFERDVVRDEFGKPKLLYHGTNQNIERFKRNKFGVCSSLSRDKCKGFFFTDSPEEASAYADRAADTMFPDADERGTYIEQANEADPEMRSYR